MGFIFKGSSHYLIEKGVPNYQNMRRFNISENDILAQLRQRLNTEDDSSVDFAILERTGSISFIKKKMF